jgi:hypothetical protein
VRLYALVEAGDSEAIDVYLCEQDAQRALEDCLRDEPEWHGLLRVQEIEFAGILQSQTEDLTHDRPMSILAAVQK